MLESSITLYCGVIKGLLKTVFYKEILLGISEQFCLANSTTGRFLLCVYEALIFFPFVDYDPIFQLMENVQGPLDVRKMFVLEIIKEAERFRKKPLVQALEEWMSRLGAPVQDKQRTKPKQPSIVR